MADSTLGVVAFWLALGGMAVGLFGIGAAAVRALTFIGAAVSLAGALWLLARTSTNGNVVLALPLALQAEVSLSTSLLLSVQAWIAFVVALRDLRSAVNASSPARSWIAVPIALGLAVVLRDPVHSAIAFLTAASLCIAISPSDAPRTKRPLMAVCGLSIVAAALAVADRIDFHAEELASPWLTRETFLGAALALGVLATFLAANPSPHVRPRAYFAALPSLLAAYIVLRFNSDLMGRARAIVIAAVALLSVWFGWSALRARRPVGQGFLALALLIWLIRPELQIAAVVALATTALAVAALQAFPRNAKGDREDFLVRTAVRAMVASAGVFVVAPLVQLLWDVARTTAFRTPQGGLWSLSLAAALTGVVLASGGVAAALRRIGRDEDRAADPAANNEQPVLLAAACVGISLAPLAFRLGAAEKLEVSRLSFLVATCLVVAGLLIGRQFAKWPPIGQAKSLREPSHPPGWQSRFWETPESLIAGLAKPSKRGTLIMAHPVSFGALLLLVGIAGFIALLLASTAKVH